MHVVQWTEAAKRQGKIFNDSMRWLLLLCEPSVPAKLMPQNESTAVRAYDDILDLFEFHRADNELPEPQKPAHAPTFSSDASLFDCQKNKPTSWCFTSTSKFQEHSRCDFGRRLSCVN